MLNNERAAAVGAALRKKHSSKSSLDVLGAALVGLKTPKVGMAHRSLSKDTGIPMLPSSALESSSGARSASAILAAQSKVEVS